MSVFTVCLNSVHIAWRYQPGGTPGVLGVTTNVNFREEAWVMYQRLLCAVCFVCLALSTGMARGEPFSYQGELADGGVVASGIYIFEFTLRATSDSSSVAAPVTKVVDVVDGMFSVDLEFGAGAFDGEGRSLQIHVRPDGSLPGDWTELLPWSVINATPYAMKSLGAEISRDSDVLGVGDGNDRLIVNSSLSGGVTSTITTMFQVNFNHAFNGGMRVNSGPLGGTPFYGFTASNSVLGQIDFEPSLYQFEFLHGIGSVPSFVIGNGYASAPLLFSVGADLDVGQDLDVARDAGVGGDLSVGNILSVENDITKDYGTNEYTPAIPIAYGTFGPDGTRYSGTKNLTAVWDVSSASYLLTIESKFYNYANFSAMVTPIGISATFAITNSVSGKLKIYLKNLSGVNTQSGFQVVIYDGN